MTRFLCILILSVAGVLRVAAAPLERPVGFGLTYFRVHELPADLPEKRASACVLDLRYVGGDSSAASTVETWLKGRATTRAPVFVIVNAKTSPALLAMLGRYERGRGVVVVARAFAGFKPDIAVSSSNEDERRAYDALEQGAPIASLLTDNPNKVRNDEASLSKDRLAEASAEAVGEAAGNKPPPPPIDAALQRAVHLHRALLALKKL